MMTYTHAPKCARYERMIEGTNPAGVRVRVEVDEHKGTRYARFYMDGERVYARQYSGRNLAELDQQLDELLDGLSGATLWEG